MINNRHSKYQEDEHSQKVVESINVFSLLRNNLIKGLRLIHNNDRDIKDLAFRTLFIDINSFIDELSIFEGVVYASERENYRHTNSFLLVTHELRTETRRIILLTP
jgi:hypothetical protein